MHLVVARLLSVHVCHLLPTSDIALAFFKDLDFGYSLNIYKLQWTVAAERLLVNPNLLAWGIYPPGQCMDTLLKPPSPMSTSSNVEPLPRCMQFYTSFSERWKATVNDNKTKNIGLKT